jgi:hypothetical protein
MHLIEFSLRHSIIVLGVIDRVGRPDPRSRPGFFWGCDRSSGRDPDFFMGCDPFRSRPIFKKREIHEKSRKATQLDKIRKKFGSRPPGSRPKLGSRPGKFSGRDPKFFRVTIPTRSRPPTLLYHDIAFPIQAIPIELD